MEENQSQKIVGVRFSKVGKIYHFDATKIENLRLGDIAVVETSRGWQLGEVILFVDQPEKPAEGGWKPINRIATPKDLLQWQSWQAKQAEVVEECIKRVKELKLTGIKVVSSEYSFDGSRLTILFSSDSEEKAELKSLRADMQKKYALAQVELRQIGPRDVAKIMGGMGACGLECRCCSKYITEFSSISIKMAKEQGISLTPTEITGMCGRLRCCLIYEYENYLEARKTLPKKNKHVITPNGQGKVIDVYPMREAILVELPEIGRREFHKDEVKLVEEAEILEKAARDFVQKQSEGGCESCSQKNLE